MSAVTAKTATQTSRSSTRRLLTLVMMLVTVGALSGCSSNDLEYEPSIGSNARTPSMQALSLAVVTDGEGLGTLVGTMVNEGDETDRLVDVQATAETGPIPTRLPGGPVALPTDEPVRLSTTKAVLMESDNLRQGYWVDLTLSFADSRQMTLKAPVEPRSGPYAEIEITRPADEDVSP